MTGVSCKDLVNSKNCEEKTCLQLAVQGGHVEVGVHSLLLITISMIVVRVEVIVVTIITKIKKKRTTVGRQRI